MAALNLPDPVQLAAGVAQVFEYLGIRYILGGSLASTAFGEPRATLDVDFAADMQQDDVLPFIAALQAEFFIDEQAMVEAIRQRSSFQLLHQASMTRVDVFVPEWTGVHLWKWERRHRLEIGDGPATGIDVTSPEGIVLQKLAWYQLGGEVSDRQWRDVLGVLKTQRETMQRDDLVHWAERLGIVDLLQRALKQAGLD